MMELNEKLARWAGFERKQRNRWVIDRYESCDSWELHAEYPRAYSNFSLPNFTSSLDACFKWLVPKLKEKHNEWKIEFIDTSEVILCPISGWGKPAYKKNFRWETISKGIGENPALALCKAIEQLIDKENHEVP